MKKLEHIVNATVKECGKCKKEWSMLDIMNNSHKVKLSGELDDGIWWACDCKSTLFLPFRRKKEE